MSEQAKTYFIKCAKTGRIKIGRSVKPKERLADLQVASPTELELIGTVDADYEAELHREFRDCRLRGEWFQPHRDLVAVVSHLTGWNWHGTSCQVAHKRALAAYWHRSRERRRARLADERLRFQKEYRKLLDVAGELAQAVTYLFWADGSGYHHRDASRFHPSRSLRDDIRRATERAHDVADQLEEHEFDAYPDFAPKRRNREATWGFLLGLVANGAGRGGAAR